MRDSIDTSINHFDAIREILGHNYSQYHLESSYDFIGIAQQGINASIIKNFIEYFDITLGKTSQLLSVSEPSIYRWIKSNKVLDQNVSIKLLEIVDLFLIGIKLFGNKERFFKWLYLPNTSLGGMQPNALIPLPEGVTKVKDVLGRIWHGVYS